MSQPSNNVLERAEKGAGQNNWQHGQREVRLFQTDLTDEEFSNSNLVVVEPKLHGAMARIVLDSKCEWNSHNFILTKAPAYRFLAHEGEYNWHWLHQGRSDWRHDYQKRLSELKGAAEDEGIKLNKRSSIDAAAFLERAQLPSRPAVFLLENGNIRLLWADSVGNQIGLQFLGDETVQYVCFKKDEDGFVERSIGNRRSRGLRAFLEALGLSGLLFEVKTTG